MVRIRVERLRVEPGEAFDFPPIYETFSSALRIIRMIHRELQNYGEARCHKFNWLCMVVKNLHARDAAGARLKKPLCGGRRDG